MASVIPKSDSIPEYYTEILHNSRPDHLGLPITPSRIMIIREYNTRIPDNDHAGLSICLIMDIFYFDWD